MYDTNNPNVVELADDVLGVEDVNLEPATPEGYARLTVTFTLRPHKEYAPDNLTLHLTNGVNHVMLSPTHPFATTATGKAATVAPTSEIVPGRATRHTGVQTAYGDASDSEPVMNKRASEEAGYPIIEQVPVLDRGGNISAIDRTDAEYDQQQQVEHQAQRGIAGQPNYESDSSVPDQYMAHGSEESRDDDDRAENDQEQPEASTGTSTMQHPYANATEEYAQSQPVAPENDETTHKGKGNKSKKSASNDDPTV